MTGISAAARMLIFGRNGQLGSELLKSFSQRKGFDVYATNRQDVDLQDVSAIKKYIEDIAPHWVINAAAYTAVDQAESDVENAFKINTKAPEAMAIACSRLNAKFIHYSTDYVFDGCSQRPYLESDTVNPLNIYGESKAIGEQNVLKIMPNALIFRTSWVYSKTGNNFVNTMLRLAQTHAELRVVDDQFGSPTLADDLASVTANIVEKIYRGELNFQGGIFHATSQQQTTWKDFCQEIILWLENFPQVKVTGINTKSGPTVVKRPLYSVLSNEKLAEQYQQKLLPWSQALKYCLSVKAELNSD